MRARATRGGQDGAVSGVALNAKGSIAAVVGTAAIRAGVGHAFLWTGGPLQDLGTLGGSASFADGINSAGQIVGGAETAAQATHAFLFSGGRLLDLGTLGGGNSTATGINAAGQIVGNSETTA